MATLARLFLVTIALATAGFAGGSGAALAAASFGVNSTADTVDAALGNGVCADSAGSCTLRAAVMESNALAGDDTITVPPGNYDLIRPGRDENSAATGDLDITGILTIVGAAPGTTIIDAGGVDRVLEIQPGAAIRIQNVSLRNGYAGHSTNGGGISNNGGTLTATDIGVSGSRACSGGGIASAGITATATIVRATVTGNSGGGCYAAADGLGGGIFNAGTMTLVESTVSGNTAPGVYWFHPGGGGIFNQRTLTVHSSTVSGNTDGGGLVNFDGTLTIVNSTISGNVSSTGYGGGGILAFSWFAPPVTTLLHTTVAENRNIWGRGDAVATRGNGTFSVFASVLASPTNGFGGDCYGGPWSSLGRNIVDDGSCGLSGTGDLNSTNPLLSPLGSSGGPTMTHVPLPGSPAIDVVPVVDCTLSTDQRGTSRPQGAACDIGSVEGVFDTTPPTVTCSATPKTLWPPNHKLRVVTVAVVVTDSGSGPAGFKLVSATSSEPDNGLGDGDTAGDIQGWTTGTADTSGMLRAERSGAGTGRVYTLTYEGADAAGNTATCSTTVTVPHDQGK